MSDTSLVPSATPTAHRGSARWIFVVAALALAVGAFLWFKRGAAAQGGSASAAPGADRPVPVSVIKVESRDVPVHLEGIGSATALMTVTVRSQVDGRLDRVLFKEGQEVKRGEVLAQVDPRAFQIQLSLAEAARARDEALLKNTQLNLERYRSLRAQNLIPQQQFDDQNALASQQAAALLADRAQTDNARLLLNYATITSPLAGVTGVRLIDPGNLVRASEATGIVVVTQIDPMGVIFTLPQDDLPRVQAHMAQGPVELDAFARDGVTLLGHGQLSVIDNQVNSNTATIRIKAIVPNPERKLWPNLFVKVRLLIETKPGVLVIPAQAVQRGPQGSFVYLVERGDQARVAPVEVSGFEEGLALIARGLKAGDSVVFEGQSQLKPGAKVAPKAAESSRPAPAPAGSR